MREALHVAQGITHDAVRAQVLGELSKNIPAELHGDAVEMARGLADEGTCALALISLLEHLPDDQRSRVAREALSALQSVEDESVLAAALKDLGPHLSTRLRAEAIRDTLAATLKGLDAQGQDADEWMEEARGYLDSGQMEEALASAVHAEPVVGNRRAELLAEIASAWKA